LREQIPETIRARRTWELATDTHNSQWLVQLVSHTFKFRLRCLERCGNLLVRPIGG
jgi:hypothetical protein